MNALQVRGAGHASEVHKPRTIQERRLPVKASALLVLTSTLALFAHSAYGKPHAAIRSPTHGVLCDNSMCADEKGVSRTLTAKYLGEKKATALFSQGAFDLTMFTFSNGTSCDTKERMCREDRYYSPDGQRSGKVSAKYTEILFGK
jgi:Fels-1 Prophage Protein-like